MAASVSDELEQFHRFIADKLAKGESAVSPEAAVDQWRELHPSSDDLAEDVTAIKEALADLAAGDKGQPLDQFDRDFRAEHNLTPRP